jgi:hypothetical protein
MLKSLQDAASALAIVDQVYRQNGPSEVQACVQDGGVDDCSAVSNNAER